jgi:rhodanese-related sulfurtransferase
MLSSEPPAVIDVRSPTMRDLLARRIPGAIGLTLDELKTCPLEGLEPKVVLYCTCPNEASAAGGARILRSRGHPDAAVLRGGLDAWMQAGYESVVSADTGRAGADTALTRTWGRVRP